MLSHLKILTSIQAESAHGNRQPTMWLWGADSLGGSSGLTQPPIFSCRRLFCIFQRKDFIFLRDLLVSKVILQKMMMSHIHLLLVNTGLPCCAQGQAWSLFSWRSWFSSDFSYDQHFQNDSIWCKREHGAFFWGGDTKVDAKHFGGKKKKGRWYTCWLESLGASRVKLEPGFHTQRTRKQQKYTKHTPGW